MKEIIKIEEKEIPVELNSKEGVMWKQTLMATEQKIQIGKIQSELDNVVLNYCKKKVEEDSKKVKQDLEKE